MQSIRDTRLLAATGIAPPLPGAILISDHLPETHHLGHECADVGLWPAFLQDAEVDIIEKRTNIPPKLYYHFTSTRYYGQISGSLSRRST